jgi:hypothetical protein
MKKAKPSDYRTGLRFLKKENIPPGGSVFAITNLDDVDKSTAANAHDWRLRLTLDGRWWFELVPGNLDAVIELLGDDFGNWYQKRVGIRIAPFTTKDGEDKEYMQIVPAQDVTVKKPLPRGLAQMKKKSVPEDNPFEP